MHCVEKDYNELIDSYTSPTLCPVCKASVFFYKSPYGGRVFFDSLGSPWPKHPCTSDKGDMCTLILAESLENSSIEIFYPALILKISAAVKCQAVKMQVERITQVVYLEISTVVRDDFLRNLQNEKQLKAFILKKKENRYLKIRLFESEKNYQDIYGYFTQDIPRTEKISYRSKRRKDNSRRINVINEPLRNKLPLDALTQVGKSK